MKKQSDDSPLSLAIIGLLSIRAMSGYDLRKIFLTTGMKAFSASPGAIYPALRRLEKAGRIEGKVERKSTLRPRMVFTLSQRGRAVFVESLTRPVTREDVVRRMDNLLLRFSFMSDLVGIDKIADFLHAFSMETEGYLGELEVEIREYAPDLSFSGKAALTQGVESFRATARWARKTLAELKKRHSMKGGNK
jgi:DNA-binding PadR family transcriptional regulator